MLSLPATVQIFACVRPVDLRKSFDALAALVRQDLAGDPLSGHLFLFVNKRADRLKILYWDRDGYALWYKRLEKGTFRLPAASASEAALTMNAADLAMLLAERASSQRMHLGKEEGRAQISTFWEISSSRSFASLPRPGSTPTPGEEEAGQSAGRGGQDSTST